MALHEDFEDQRSLLEHGDRPSGVLHRRVGAVTVFATAVFLIGTLWMMQPRSSASFGSTGGLIGMAETAKCTANGENCMESKCCSDKAATCFKKNDHWASCNRTCDAYNFWNPETNQFEVHENPQWECSPLGCTPDGANCTESQCCSNEGSTCFKKNDHWASCNKTCEPNNFWNFETQKFEKHKNPQWTCDVLGDQVAVECTANGKNCMDSKCCSEEGMTCFEKNEHWASCNKTCDAFNFWNTKTNQFEVHKNPQWTCNVLGDPAPVTCTANGENCMESECCSDKTATCFKKNDHWASCNRTCDAYNFWNPETNQFEVHENPQWECSPLGCTPDGANCTESQCCSNEGSTCFKKNDHWASCNKTCEPNNFWNFETQKFEKHKNPQWTCDVLGDQVAVECTANGKNCMDSKCCSEEGMTCFEKNEHWASCNKTCDAFNFWNTKTNQFEVHKNPQWTCNVLGDPAPVACTANGENCMESECCSDKTATCFKKNDHWASCNSTCDAYNFWNTKTNQFEVHKNPQWECSPLGCTPDGANCTESQCCSNEGSTCFKKNDHWASCNKTCEPNNFWNFETQQFEKHKNPQWTCDVLS